MSARTDQAQLAGRPTTVAPSRAGFRAALALVALSASAACGDDGTTIPPGDTSDTGADVPTDSDGDVAEDATPDVPPPREDLFVAYTRESTFDDSAPIELLIVDSDCRAGSAELCDPGVCDPIAVEPRNASEPLCNRGCQLTPDLGHLFFVDPDEAQTLRAVPLDQDRQPAADSRIVATGVQSYSVASGRVAYRVGNDLHVQDADGGNDRVVASFETGSGGFYLTPDGAKIFVNVVVSLTAMETRVVDLASGSELPVFKFISGEEQGTGSFYSGREAMAISPDGSRLAVITNARTSGFQCSSNADCSGVGESCLSTAIPPRCVRQELALNVINLDATDRLRQPCSGDSDCGADHFCDLTAPDSGGAGECLPGRFSLGPSGPQSCTSLRMGEYNGVRGQLGWRGDRTVLGVFTQDCIRGNILVSDLVALNLDGAAYERIIQNEGQNHGQCYDEVEGCFEPSDCNVEITTSAVSSSGGTVGLVADSVSTNLKNELWLVDAFGRSGKHILTRSIDWEVLSVSLHPAE